MTLARTAETPPGLVLAAAGWPRWSRGNDAARAGRRARGMAMTLPVAVRPRAPLAALAVAVTAALVQALAGGSLSQSVAAFVALLVLVYSVASLRAGRVAAAGLRGRAGRRLGPDADRDRARQLRARARRLRVRGAADRRRVARSATRCAAARTGSPGSRTRPCASPVSARSGRRAAVAEERARIARELHDVVAHSVSVMVVQAARRRGRARPRPGARPRSRSSRSRTGRAGADRDAPPARRCCARTSRGRRARRSPGSAGLDALADGSAPPGCRSSSTVEGDARRSPPGVDLAAYRIVQEALTNTLKHGGGAARRVSIRYAPRTRSSSRSATTAPARRRRHGGGHGLVGMRERVALYGGTLEAGPRAGRRLPRPRAAPAALAMIRVLIADDQALCAAASG